MYNQVLFLLNLVFFINNKIVQFTYMSIKKDHKKPNKQ